MTAPAHPRSPGPTASHAARAEIRLPWWAVALPVVAFGALLIMIMSPGQAQAATADPALGQLIERTLQLFFN
ncbi:MULTISPECIES: hypothetical protein [Streptomyces]|uniref:hypothetical protein n=1 Tax=Streptomyces TaxID=1883 RepID=UPI000F778184|nr:MULTISPECIES: hypothetical protein [Streptomyces]MBT3075192.1 hypothetical protein [Streptomyces sp. COG21]MBT3084329.1 hypothetical protein [Streptomyces sp. COG20]MBT3090921.1 hypothetical protein [Streptomyces sp. CYG21]MBT3099733.1 hypothetical protein [Streptomyces sp. CBG30]MBT3102313.1 hypothetical protein [Streptomyces sp. COG19]